MFCKYSPLYTLDFNRMMGLMLYRYVQHQIVAYQHNMDRIKCHINSHSGSDYDALLWHKMDKICKIICAA